MVKGLRPSSPSSALIPYYVLELPNGRKTKVLFLVPSALVPRLTIHPILCRGSSFSLTMDENNGSIDDADGSFLAVDFESPYPEDLAREIAIRLTRRLDDAQCDQEASQQNFLTLAWEWQVPHAVSDVGTIKSSGHF